MQRAFLKAFLLAAAVALAGCDNELENLTPTTPPPTTTETFDGTVNPNGAMTHTFAVSVGGEVRATLTQLAPDPATAVGFALGTWNATSSICQVVISNDNAVQGVVITGNASRAGTLCVRVYDTGRLSGTLTYALSVIHP